MTGASQLSPHQQYLPGRPTPQRYNGMAISAFVVVFFASVIGLVLGYVALSQIKQTGENGRGLALAAVIIGWVCTVGALLIAGVLVTGSLAMKLY